ncbi:oligosaccharide repeat unit polymerase [Paraburkholderia sp. MMS20-SJTR3]|uniref:Oligosaccharide repeat unit polymerase n=1 Tax=Paraburkholderia sejongensis TaxID=2886946 RepID=A0ABS8K3S6_9BURK|nr:oligosaccharide repeat unit polymerase [Paraburkholderia sp. MMS20-SJTR3]MCC8396814.1 oligosaccharide repeat unit polymerase [Paraburkholderia sp. MMS20-SJTR3]
MDDTHDSLTTMSWDTASVRTSGQTAYNGYWWEDPTRLLLFFILPLYVLLSIELLGEQKAITHIYYTGFYAFAGGLFLVVVMVVSSIGRASTPVVPRTPVEIPVRVLDFVFFLAILGYAIMMGQVLSHPAMILSFFRGTTTVYELLEIKGRIAGLSTLTEATMAYVPLYFYVFKQVQRGFNRYKLYLIVLGLLTLLRSFVFAERLAVIEVALPAVLMYVRFRGRSRRSKLLTFGPFAAIGPMLGLFIVNEYHRSWETYYINIYDNIFDFAIERLALYYSTALNNGSGMLTMLGWGSGSPMYTFDWLIHFPVIGEFIKPLLDSSADFESFLNNHADPEFNNPSGIFVHFYEWGWFALFIAVFIGWSFNRSYTGWRSGDGFWCCAHSALYVCLLEILRIPNLFSGRNLVPLGVLFVVFHFMKRP